MSERRIEDMSSQELLETLLSEMGLPTDVSVEELVPLDITSRHPSVVDVFQWFDYAHLPPHLRAVSESVHDLAHLMVADLPDCPELTTGLRKLLEAKDCFVRAAVLAHEHDPYDQRTSRNTGAHTTHTENQ